MGTPGIAAALQSVWRGLASPEELRLLAECKDDSVDDGLALQLELLDRWLAEGEALGGWKVGLCSRGARDAMGPGVRPFGYILACRVLPGRSTVRVAPTSGLRIEPEICLTMGADLGGASVTPDQARAAVASVRPSFELVQQRLPAGMARAVRLGNGLNNWGIVVGGEPPIRDVDLADVVVELWHDGTSLGSGQSDPSVVDDPYLSLSRMCGHLSRQGRQLTAGQHVITGSVLPAQDLTAGHWRAEFGPLGAVELMVQ